MLEKFARQWAGLRKTLWIDWRRRELREAFCIIKGSFRILISGERPWNYLRLRKLQIN